MQIKTFLKQNIYLWFALVIVIILVCLPVFDTFYSIGAKWQGVTPMFTGDSYYYYSRIKEVSDGNIFIGNPYFLEHSKEVAPAFFVADWIAAVPLLLGFSFTFTVIFNLIFWSVIFAWLFYLLLRQFNLPGPFCLLGTVLMYVEVYRLMFRPVSMQTVFPFFILFLLSFVIWHRNSSDKKAMVFLTLAMTAAFYIYTYLWQIILVFVFLTIVYFYLIKDKKKAYNLLLAILISHLLSLPLIIYTIKQISHPYYWESMERIGLVYTHLPAANVIYSGIWIIFALLLLFFSYFWVKDLKNNQDYKNLFVFSALSGIAMLIVSGSNIITGKELENSQHIERFIIVWLVIVFIGYLFHLVKNKINFKQITIYKKIVLFILLLLCLAGVNRYLQTLTGGGYLLRAVNGGFSRSTSEEQDFLQPLNWLENNELEQKVVWVIPYNSPINNYLNILTKHYSLYTVSGENYLVSQKEIEERYLTSRYFDNLKQVDIENNYWDYGGVGKAVHQYKTHNRKVKICKILHLNLLNYDCGQLTDAISYKGKEYFSGLYSQYQKEIVPNINQELKKFNVSYILLDRESAANFDLLKIKNIKKVYQDQNFLIYKIL